MKRKALLAPLGALARPLGVLLLVLLGVLCGYVLRGDKTETIYADDDPRFNHEAAITRVCELYGSLYEGVNDSETHVETLVEMARASVYTPLADDVDRLVVLTLDPSNNLNSIEGMAYVEDMTREHENAIRKTCNMPAHQS